VIFPVVGIAIVLRLTAILTRFNAPRGNACMWLANYLFNCPFVEDSTDRSKLVYHPFSFKRLYRLLSNVSQSSSGCKKFQIEKLQIEKLSR